MSGYLDDDLTDEEKKLLADEGAGPPVEPVEPPPSDTDAVTAAPADAATPAVAAEAAPEEGVAELDAFKAQHAGKTPEELLRIAFQQQKRANSEGFKARQSQERIDAILKRAEDIRTTAAADAAAKRAALDKTLADDPDAAVRMLADERSQKAIDAANAEADGLVHQAQVDEAISFAAQAFPDFGERAPKMFSLGKELGYSEAELHGVNDGRALVVLGLAEMAASLMKAGMIDTAGRLIAPSATTASPVDPRLQAPPAPTSARSGGGAAAPAKTGDDRLKSVMQMSDADFAKMGDAEFAKLFA